MIPHLLNNDLSFQKLHNLIVFNKLRYTSPVKLNEPYFSLMLEAEQAQNSQDVQYGRRILRDVYRLRAAKLLTEIDEHEIRRQLMFVIMLDDE